MSHKLFLLLSFSRRNFIRTSSPICAPCPNCISLVSFITLCIKRRVKFIKPSLCSFLYIKASSDRLTSTIFYTVVYRLIARKRPRNNDTTAVVGQWPASQWTLWKAVFSVWSTTMTALAKMDTATEERFFSVWSVLVVISRTISEFNSVK